MNYFVYNLKRCEFNDFRIKIMDFGLIFMLTKMIWQRKYQSGVAGCYTKDDNPLCSFFTKATRRYKGSHTHKYNELCQVSKTSHL